MGTPTTTVLYEAWHDGGFLVSEANGHRSRDRIMLAAGGRYLPARCWASRQRPAPRQRLAGRTRVTAR
ncbi:hypothetical protein DDE05_00560 [Streptomyces cavourensis]|nr:hypothetical protein DDE05_00560 [Streptomyces cavourensis]